MKRVVLPVMLSWLLGACGGMRCDKPDQYADSRSVPPVRIPDGLTAPEQSEGLRIPELPADKPPKVISKRGPCLESPPNYFENGIEGIDG